MVVSPIPLLGVRGFDNPRVRLFCDTFVFNLGGMERKSRELLLQTGYLQTQLAILYYNSLCWPRILRQLPLKPHSFFVMYLFHLSQLRAEVMRRRGVPFSGARHKDIQEFLSTRDFLEDPRGIVDLYLVAVTGG